MSGMLPTIGITMGDPAGIGPEIVAKALSRPDVYEWCRPVVFGERRMMERALSLLALPSKIVEAVGPDAALVEPSANVLALVDIGFPSSPPAFGELSPEAGDAAYRYVKEAVQYGMAGRIDAICTAPLNKEAMHLGGHRYPGHTELLAELMGVTEYAMMLAAPRLRVIHATTHIGLVEAIATLTPARVLRVIRLAHDLLKNGGMDKPRIAVCGINPHAGENGLFGQGEEEAKIVPAVQEAAAAGIEVTGPYPADTLFYRAVKGDFDVVVAMYHDQGHIPVKVLGLEQGVNISVGMPLVRTSVDHGTAFDIAGTGKADESSLLEAIRQAALLTRTPKERREASC
ncbi:4-hydroxythreonine-4-phosphate dehydrogenase PdxA [Paenibacillus sp. CC-CFT747]|nr:4-hydroxythreonine-4-phosphate dehydrogenase PdxA [Paenibacillus sp. CC-CFT747]